MSSSPRQSVEAYRLNADRKRILQLLSPLFKDEQELLRFADFIDKMPWNYAREVAPEIIAAHWKILRNLDLSQTQQNAPENYMMRHDGAESWIGDADLVRIPLVVRKLCNNERSPLQRIFVHEERRIAVVLVYSKQDNSKRAYPLDPPEWLGKFKRTVVNNRKLASSISFDTAVLERSTLFRIEVRNSPQSTVIRKICEILSAHQLTPASIDLWSTYNGWTGSKKIKENHSIEIELRESLEDDIIQSIKDDCHRYLVAMLRVHSLFDIIGPAMNGPSSSHTAGACRIGQAARQLFFALQAADHFKKITNFKIKLFGSFRDTGPGHGTNIALGAGLKGLAPDAIDMKAEGDLQKLLQDGIPWREQGPVPFLGFEAAPLDDDKRYIKQIGDCNNIAEVIAETDNGCFSITGFSTGGGLIELRFLNQSRILPSITGKRDLWIGPPPLGNKLKVSREASKNAAIFRKIYPQVAPADNLQATFNTFDEALELCKETGKSLLDLAIEVESSLQGSNETDILENMLALWQVMKSSVLEGLANHHRSNMGLSGGDSSKLKAYIEARRYTSFHTLASIYALASSETNAQMGRIVACPTAGACGIIPGVMLAWYEVHACQGLDQNTLELRIVKALLVAAFIGMIFYDDIPTAGATLGCQAEIGIGAAMAASAVAQLNGGSPEDVVHAAILTIKNCMGLVCDPVGGLVEVPCIKRNAMYSTFAITAADMARAGIRSQIPPDQVVLAVKEVGENMHNKYKETARGGLAVTLNGKDIARRFEEMCRQCRVCG